MARKKDVRCDICEYHEWLLYARAWTCLHQDYKGSPIFKGNTHPNGCPLAYDKKK